MRFRKHTYFSENLSYSRKKFYQESKYFGNEEGLQGITQRILIAFWYLILIWTANIFQEFPEEVVTL